MRGGIVTRGKHCRYATRRKSAVDSGEAGREPEGLCSAIDPSMTAAFVAGGDEGGTQYGTCSAHMCFNRTPRVQLARSLAVPSMHMSLK